MQIWLIILAGDLMLMSLVTLGFYAWDKRQSRNRGWRVPESRLHVLSLLGGWPGALIGQRWLRHKSVKKKFRAVFWLTVVVHVAIVSAATFVIAHLQR